MYQACYLLAFRVLDLRQGHLSPKLLELRFAFLVLPSMDTPFTVVWEKREKALV